MAGIWWFSCYACIGLKGLIVVATDNVCIPNTGARLSPAAEKSARDDARPPTSNAHINPVQHNKGVTMPQCVCSSWCSLMSLLNHGEPFHGKYRDARRHACCHLESEPEHKRRHPNLQGLRQGAPLRSILVLPHQLPPPILQGLGRNAIASSPSRSSAYNSHQIPNQSSRIVAQVLFMPNQEMDGFEVAPHGRASLVCGFLLRIVCGTSQMVVFLSLLTLSVASNVLRQRRAEGRLICRGNKHHRQ